jgi:hypothetical protein
MWRFAAMGQIGDVEEGLAGQFTHLGIGVAEEPEQQMHPTQFVGLDTDH